MTRSFTAVAERDPETSWLVGEVVALPGCCAQAPDMATLEANVKEAIAVYAEAIGLWQARANGHGPSVRRGT